MSQISHDSNHVSELVYFYFVFQTMHSNLKNPGFLEIVQIWNKIHRARPKSVTVMSLKAYNP